MWISSGKMYDLFHGNFSDTDQRTAILCITGKNLIDENSNYGTTTQNSDMQRKNIT